MRLVLILMNLFARAVLLAIDLPVLLLRQMSVIHLPVSANLLVDMLFPILNISGLVG